MTTKKEQSTGAVENNSVATQEDMKAMFMAKMTELMEMGKAMGFDLAKEMTNAEAPLVTEQPTRALPGTRIGGDGINAIWQPWTRDDLDPSNKVPVMVNYYADIAWPIPDEDGNHSIPVTANGLTCWLLCGRVNMVDPMFAEVYQHAEEAHKSVKAFAAKGPDNAPWSRVGRNQINTWFQSLATTFGMDIEGDVWDGEGLAIVERLKAEAAAGE